ncbi:hypothetical protein BDU57DRAFT_546645 [Ampelomyces quisqualis]|uniref:Uncharacterized protein n=1 Tax=Ampelomyces quisqualis TaxID=50730 RepID=A0A6A5QTS6_AMPQU|nr:hypothetical protein BDU57DRAFT_546645 [Ampelomyces quisqualis]
MRVYLLVFAAALSGLSDATQIHSDLAYSSSNEFNGSLPALQRRWDAKGKLAADDDWNRYVRKGSKLIAQMSYSDFDAAQMFDEPKTTAQSPYGYNSLTKWGYNLYEPVGVRFCDFGYWGISNYLMNNGKSHQCQWLSEEGTWRAAVIMHGDRKKEIEGQEYKGPDGKTRPATGAAFYMAVTPEGGIMTQSRKSPWESLRKKHPDASQASLPKMQRSSDMMWAMWERLIPPSHLNQVSFFISVGIVNRITLSLMRRALEKVGEELSGNGVHISTDTDEGKALLSSPNGAGFAYFLIERKAQIGIKSIKSIQLMKCEGVTESACMAFHVENLRAPAPPKH